jgi:hypothetical protein
VSLEILPAVLHNEEEGVDAGVGLAEVDWRRSASISCGTQASSNLLCVCVCVCECVCARAHK